MASLRKNRRPPKSIDHQQTTELNKVLMPSSTSQLLTSLTHRSNSGISYNMCVFIYTSNAMEITPYVV